MLVQRTKALKSEPLPSVVFGCFLVEAMEYKFQGMTRVTAIIFKYQGLVRMVTIRELQRPTVLIERFWPRNTTFCSRHQSFIHLHKRLQNHLHIPQ